MAAISRCLCGAIMSRTPSSRRRTTPCFVSIESDGIIGNFNARHQGKARDKAVGKTHNADKVICIDRTTFRALGTWRNRHDPGRQFVGPGYHPGDYVFTLVNMPAASGHDPTAVRPPRRCGRVPCISFDGTNRQPAGGALKAGVSPKIIGERIGPNADASR